MYDKKRVRVFECDGFTILVGKSAKDNEYLTFEIAKPNDLWLHIGKYSGSHVVIVSKESCEITDDAIKYAGALAKWYSKGYNPRSVVHICEARFVTKKKGTPDGQVSISNFNVI